MSNQQPEYLGDRRELQLVIEIATDAVYKTGNPIFYDILRRYNVKGQLLDIIREENKSNGNA